MINFQSLFNETMIKQFKNCCIGHSLKIENWKLKITTVAHHEIKIIPKS